MSITRRQALSAGAVFGLQTLYPNAVDAQASFAVAPPAGSGGQTISPDQTIAWKLGRFIAQAEFEDIPAEVLEKAKGQIIFLLGRAFEAHSAPDAANLRQVFAQFHTQSGSSVVGGEYKLDPPHAALVNGSLMRGKTGSDDVIWPAGIHAGSITLPSALAVAEEKGASGKELLLALVLGYEILGKLGSLADTWTARPPRRPTNVFGGFGPVTVVARLLKLDQRRTAAAMGYAANCTLGIPEGGMMPHYYGLINNIGLLSAYMAAAGAEPYSTTTIEGDTGLFQSTFGKIPGDLEAAVAGLGTNWEIMTAEQKRYPGTGQNAVAIDLFLKLLKREGLTAHKIRRIDVVQPGASDSTVRKNEVASQGPFARPVSAYSSLPFALAHAMLEGGVAEEWYLDTVSLDRLNDPRIAAEMRKVFLTFEDRHSTPRYCRLQVLTSDGRLIKEQVEDYSFPFPRDDWGPWLNSRGDDLLGRHKLERVLQQVQNLEQVDDITTLMSNLRPG